MKKRASKTEKNTKCTVWRGKRSTSRLNVAPEAYYRKEDVVAKEISVIKEKPNLH